MMMMMLMTMIMMMINFDSYRRKLKAGKCYQVSCQTVHVWFVVVYKYEY